LPLKTLECWPNPSFYELRRWTANPEVNELFDETATMVTQDKQTFHGKEPVLRRLDKGKL
jgi:hypothetical protein